METKGYETLEIYQKSYKLAREIYTITREYPREEIYGITSQMRRAALSIPLNIAEGYGRKGTGSEDFKHFLRLSRGSCNEMKVLIEFSYDIDLLDKEKRNDLQKRYEEISKMIYGYMKVITAKS